MIREEDLREAIAECEGVPKPNANTCIKLAAFYTILNYMEKPTTAQVPAHENTENLYSYASYPDSEFGKLAERRGIDAVFDVIDELMDTLQIVNPRLYDSVSRKISDMM